MSFPRNVLRPLALALQCRKLAACRAIHVHSAELELIGAIDWFAAGSAPGLEPRPRPQSSLLRARGGQWLNFPMPEIPRAPGGKLEEPNMAKVVVTAQVQDPVKWEPDFAPTAICFAA
jgi:hypothetical protein